MKLFCNNSFFQIALAGILIGISYHPLNLGWLSWIGFIPLIIVFCRGNYLHNIWYGYLFGIVYNSIAFYWIGNNSGASFGVVISSFIAAILYLSTFWALAGGIFSFISFNNRKILGVFSFPFLIVSIEWIRSFGPLGFPWSNLALTQTDFTYLIQFIDITGSYGLSFLILCINSILYVSYKQKCFLRYGIIPLCIIIIGINIVGKARFKFYNFSNKEIEVAVVQPNVNPNTKWDRKKQIIELMNSMHLEAVRMNPDIVVFPETALPVYLTRDHRIRNALQGVVDYYNIPLLTGTIDLKYINSNKNYFNSAMLLSPNKKYQLYSKIHLVPFAEYDLFPNIFHPLTFLNLNINRGHFQPGTDFKLFELKNILFSDLICYESSMPNIAREFINKGSEFLIIQANDGWLGDSYGPYQHFELARLRAIENRVPIIRAANTGISGIIYPDGSVQKKVGIGKQQVFMEKIKFGENKSLYSIYGDIIAIVCFLVTTLFVGYICKKQYYS